MKIKSLILLSLSLFYLSNLYGETLQEVVKGTLVVNPQIQSLRLNTKAYRLYVDEEKGKQYPTINLNTYFEDLNSNSKGVKSNKNGTNTQLSLEQTLFDGWLISSKIDETNFDYKSNKIQNIATIENVVLDSVNAYLNVVKNHELILLSENNLLVHEGYLDVAKKSEVVSGDALDRLQVESKLSSVKAKFSEVRRADSEARANLEKLYGKKLTSNYCRPVILENEFTNLDDIITKAMVVNYDILSEIQKIKKQRAIVSQEKSRFFPTIKVKLLHEVDDGVDVKNTKKTDNSVRLTLNYNLFNGLQDHTIHEREMIFLKEAQKSLDDVVNGVVESIKINYTNLKTAKKRIEYLTNYLDTNKDILLVYLEQFQGGTRNFIDILNHEAELFRAKTDLINEEYIYSNSYYELLKIVSKLSTTVLNSKKQMCEEIVVDIEKRNITLEEAEEEDADLAALLDEEDTGSILSEDKDNKEEKVQSMLNKILDEIYSPNAVNKSIRVSNISYKNLDGVSKDSQPDIENPDIQELIKEQQELEEQQIRDEQNILKEQIKQETEKLIKTDVVEEPKDEIIKDKSLETEEKKTKQSENKVVQKEESTPKTAVTTTAPVNEKTKEENSALTAENKELTDDTKTVSEDMKPLNSEVVKKELTLQERQAISRKLGEEYRRKFLEKIAREEAKTRKTVKPKQETAQLKETVVQKENSVTNKKEMVASKTIKELTPKEVLAQKQKEREELSKKLAQEYRKNYEKRVAKENARKLAEKKKILMEKAKKELIDKSEKTEQTAVVTQPVPKVPSKIKKEALTQVKSYSESTSVKKNILPAVKKQKAIKKPELKSEVKKEKREYSLEEAFAQKKSKKYTLAILTLSKDQKPSFIKKLYNLKKNILIYKSQNNGTNYYKVLYGVYDSSKEAKEDMKTLHKRLQKSGVFVNKISRHQKLYKKYNKNGDNQ